MFLFQMYTDDADTQMDFTSMSVNQVEDFISNTLNLPEIATKFRGKVLHF